MLKAVQAIFIRQVTKGDFFAVEKHPDNAPTGGGGQTYFDIPLSKSGLTQQALWQFFNVAPPANIETDPWPKPEVEVRTIGAPDVISPLSFNPRKADIPLSGKQNNRYRINNQARQYSGGNRHPAWTAERGFPEAPDDIADKDDARIPDVSKLKIYVVKTYDDEYYAGFVNTDVMPADWPSGLQLETLFNTGVSSKMLYYTDGQAADVPPLVRRILEAWKRKKNVLLYGPPGTGKTYAMQKLWELLGDSSGGQGLAIDPDDKENPFHTLDLDLPFPAPVRREWVTFHQNFSYENFILSLRPDSSTGNLKLVPRAGVLLDAAMSVDPALDNQKPYGSAVIYIDEVNRGNVSRIFGEFITFMDEEYRAHNGDRALPVPLSSLRHEDQNRTEPVERIQDEPLSLPIPWHFPEHVYLLASMNSVDRAVAPLDTALGRRFERIEVGPDLNFLAQYFGLNDTARLLGKITTSQPDNEIADESDFGEDELSSDETADTEEDPEEAATPPTTLLTATETAWLLLYRFNYELAATLGEDFEIGHTYMMPVKGAEDATEEDRFRTLASIWDGAIYPQLRERFANRPEELHKLLRFNDAHSSQTSKSQYIFKPRHKPPIESGLRARLIVEVISLREAATTDIEAVKYTLRYLAGKPS